MADKNTQGQTKKGLFFDMEEQVLNFWQENKIFEKSVDKESPKGDYVFYDGPPFITGLPHYASLLPSIAKDVVPRYQTMNGYRVERIWGWDCHGLPAENKVEKELNLRNKKDIEALGVDKFVNACRDYVNVGSEQWKWYIDKIGRWVDMDNAYKTMDLNFMESIMWAFKELHNKGLIYEGYRTSLHCPRCATPLSKFELTMDAGSYREVEDETVTVKFELEDEPGTYILAWTTTPWTLPGNLALAVNENIDYVSMKIIDSKDERLKNDEVYIFSKKYLDKFIDLPDANEQGGNVEIFNKEVLLQNYKKTKAEYHELKGSELVGKKYKPLFDLKNEKINANDKAYKVYSADFVNTEEGTGIVHIASNFGEDDFNLGKEVGLPIVDLMDDSGIYTKEAGEEWQGEYFKKAGKKVLENLGDKKFSSEKYKHQYPHCYRCDTALIYRAQKAWYLNISKIREKMLETNQEINWFPEYFKEGRFKYNIENAPDWCLSRSRYWGSPIPVWKCDTCEKMEVLGSIKEIEEKSGKKVDDLHRPEIDNHDFACECGGKMKRVVEVFDCWFESGSMPFAQFHYPEENKEKFENKMFPADFIIEYTGQLRGWFYYLHVLANALFEDKAFKNVIVTGVLAGTDGRKMSKSYGNYPDPKETIEKYGADALRAYFMSSPIMSGGDMNLSERDIQDALRKNIMVLWNVVRFYKMFAEDHKSVNEAPQSENVLDQWILSRFNQLLATVTKNLDDYNLPEATRPITSFIDDLSTWFLRRSRDRFKGEDEQDKKSALDTTSYVLFELSKVMAPFMPFIAEQVWQAITGNEFNNKEKSVHLDTWSKAGEVDEKIIEEMQEVRKVVELALAERDKEGIKIRQPLSKLSIYNFKFSIDKYKEIIMDELNVKDVLVEKDDKDLRVELDTEITEELEQEGIKRELVRSINNLRKNEKLTIGDKAEVYWAGSEKIKQVIEKYQEELAKDVLAEKIEQKETDGKKVKINGEEVILSIKKID